jgi:fused signal recognition particle receptor
MGLLDALRRTSRRLGRALGLIEGPLDDETAEELTDELILADVGPTTAEELVEELGRRLLGAREHDAPAVELARLIARRLPEPPPPPDGPAPEIVLLLGVNGSGKTTTAAKLAHRAKTAGRKVLLAACDTFRAAAGEQLESWARRVGVPLVRHGEGGDAAAVLYDALEAARARGVDLVIADTAGRLHSKKRLMEELTKLRRVVGKALEPDHPSRGVLVIDGACGQNGLEQARAFLELDLADELILTKLDGSARGGVVVAVCAETRLPVRWIGTGEALEDLEPFDNQRFAAALVAVEPTKL